MRSHRNRLARQRGFSFGNFLTLIAIVGFGVIVKNHFSEPDISGATPHQLIQEMGQPVAKERIPRPR